MDLPSLRSSSQSVESDVDVDVTLVNNASSTNVYLTSPVPSVDTGDDDEKSTLVAVSGSAQSNTVKTKSPRSVSAVVGTDDADDADDAVGMLYPDDVDEEDDKDENSQFAGEDDHRTMTFSKRFLSKSMILILGVTMAFGFLIGRLTDFTSPHSSEIIETTMRLSASPADGPSHTHTPSSPHTPPPPPPPPPSSSISSSISPSPPSHPQSHPHRSQSQSQHVHSLLHPTDFPPSPEILLPFCASLPPYFEWYVNHRLEIGDEPPLDSHIEIPYKFNYYDPAAMIKAPLRPTSSGSEPEKLPLGVPSESNTIGLEPDLADVMLYRIATGQWDSQFQHFIPQHDAKPNYDSRYAPIKMNDFPEHYNVLDSSNSNSSPSNSSPFNSSESNSSESNSSESNSSSSNSSSSNSSSSNSSESNSSFDSSCPFHVYTREEACSVLSELGILVLRGDSLTRHVYVALLQVLTGNPAYGQIIEKEVAEFWKSCGYEKAFGEGSCRFRIASNLRDLPQSLCDGKVRIQYEQAFALSPSWNDPFPSSSDMKLESSESIFNDAKAPNRFPYPKRDSTNTLPVEPQTADDDAETEIANNPTAGEDKTLSTPSPSVSPFSPSLHRPLIDPERSYPPSQVHPTFLRRPRRRIPSVYIFGILFHVYGGEWIERESIYRNINRNVVRLSRELPGSQIIPLFMPIHWFNADTMKERIKNEWYEKQKRQFTWANEPVKSFLIHKINAENERERQADYANQIIEELNRTSICEMNDLPGTSTFSLPCLDGRSVPHVVPAPVRWRVLDFVSLTRGLPVELVARDGVHMSQTINIWKAHLIINYVHSIVADMQAEQREEEKRWKEIKERY